MPNKTVKTLTVDGVTYDIKDAQARADIAKKQDKLPAGTTGYFLRKTATGVEWTNDIKDAQARADIAEKQDKLPDGTAGYFLRKTATGVEWTNDIKDTQARADIAEKQDKLPDGTTGYYLKKTDVGVEWAEVKSNGSGRNIGDIFYTTRKDTSLSGAVECNGGTYSTADYTGAGSVGELLKEGKLPYVSLTEYANKISTDGVCGVFGWNGGASTSFRVPLLKDVFVEAAPLSENQHGWHMAAGLPDHRHTITQPVYWGSNNTYVAAHWTADDGVMGASATATSSMASADNPIYGSSNTVQPEAVKYRAMVQLFTGTTDEAVAIVGTVVAEVANRVIKGHELIDFQVPTADNGYTWYRKYADGWVEQGGANIATGSYTTTTFPVEFRDNRYTLFSINHRNITSAWSNRFGYDKTTTNFKWIADSGIPVDWQASGIAK